MCLSSSIFVGVECQLLNSATKFKVQWKLKMSAKRHLYYKQKSRFLAKEHNTFEQNETNEKINNDENDDEDEDDEKDDECDFHDIPYSSSSIDRSSIGSIPWADDAIKQNQLDWDHVERMLNGEDSLPAEVELRNEILEWQRKFPQLIGNKTNLLTKLTAIEHLDRNTNDTSFDLHSLSSLSLNSFDEDGDDDDDDEAFDTFTLQNRFESDNTSGNQLTPTYKRYQRNNESNSEKFLLKDLRICSVPLSLRQGKTLTKNGQVYKPECNDNNGISVTRNLKQVSPIGRRVESAKSLLIVQSRPTVTTSATAMQNTRLRMPPILNVVDTKRRFRGLVNNRSFVQLTKVQQTKSAAIVHRAERGARSGNVNYSAAWHCLPQNTQFLNNRNSIILPAINLHQVREPSSSASDRAEEPHSWTSSSMSSYGINEHQRDHLFPIKTNFDANSAAKITSATGRSVSAAVHHPCTEFNTVYLPYSRSSKYKSFK